MNYIIIFFKCLFLLMVFVAMPCNAGLAVVRKSDVTLELEVKFDSNSAYIMSESRQYLNDLASELNQDKQVNRRFVIEGHTDNKGSISLNKKLSFLRAAAVKRYLVSKGVSADRLDVQGYGSERPIDLSNTDSARAVNRRVLLKYLGEIRQVSNGAVNLLIFSNQLDASSQEAQQVGKSIRSLIRYSDKVQIKDVLVYTNADCTRINVLKTLDNKKNEENIVIFLGPFVENNGKLLFRTVDTDMAIPQFTAINITDSALMMKKGSIILVNYSHFNNTTTPSEIGAEVVYAAPNVGAMRLSVLVNRISQLFESVYESYSYGEYIPQLIGKLKNLYASAR